MTTWFLLCAALSVASANETAEWQARIDAANAAGGGRVVVPAGTHPVAELELKSNVTLELAEGAALPEVGGTVKNRHGVSMAG